jgi:phosphoesterase RecJ-like protein
MDHHLFCGQIANLEVVDTSRESCCGLIAKMAMETGLQLNPLAAKSLYTGMITDSGRFRYDSVDSETFRLAAFLREQPFDTEEIYRNLYAEDLNHLRNKARFLLKIQISQGGVAYIYTDAMEVQELNMDIFAISRGMVGTMADLRGVDTWVNFTETDRGILCELRSNRYNINPIAVKYGGGGHAKASGATVKTREDAMAMLQDLENLLGE